MTHPGQLSTVKCLGPNCEQIKGNTNHWFIISLTHDEPETGGSAFTCFAYQPGVELCEGEKPVCGASCAQKLFERFLTTGEI